MEYNKQQFLKSDNKKVLHKVKKQWVVLSTALLVAIGGAAAFHVSAHAAGDARQSVDPVKAQINQNLQRTQTLSHSNSASASSESAKSTAALNEAAITHQANVLHDRIMANATNATSLGSVKDHTDDQNSKNNSDLVSYKDHAQVNPSDSTSTNSTNPRSVQQPQKPQIEVTPSAPQVGATSGTYRGLDYTSSDGTLTFTGNVTGNNMSDFWAPGYGSISPIFSNVKKIIFGTPSSAADFSSVRNMQNMFNDGTNPGITEVDFDNVTGMNKVTNMNGMFTNYGNGKHKINTIVFGKGFDMSRVSNAGGMFGADTWSNQLANPDSKLYIIPSLENKINSSTASSLGLSNPNVITVLPSDNDSAVGIYQGLNYIYDSATSTTIFTSGTLNWSAASWGGHDFVGNNNSVANNGNEACPSWIDRSKHLVFQSGVNIPSITTGSGNSNLRYFIADDSNVQSIYFAANLNDAKQNNGTSTAEDGMFTSDKNLQSLTIPNGLIYEYDNGTSSALAADYNLSEITILQSPTHNYNTELSNTGLPGSWNGMNLSNVTPGTYVKDGSGLRTGTYEGLNYVYNPNTKTLEFIDGSLTWSNSNFAGSSSFVIHGPSDLKNANHVIFDSDVNVSGAASGMTSMFESDKNLHSIVLNKNFAIQKSKGMKHNAMFVSDYSLSDVTIPQGFVNTNNYPGSRGGDGDKNLFGWSPNNNIRRLKITPVNNSDVPGGNSTIFDANAYLPNVLYDSDNQKINVSGTNLEPETYTKTPKSTSKHQSDIYTKNWIYKGTGDFVSDGQVHDWQSKGIYDGLNWKYSPSTRAVEFTGGELNWINNKNNAGNQQFIGNNDGSHYANNPYFHGFGDSCPDQIDKASSVKFDSDVVIPSVNYEYMFGDDFNIKSLVLNRDFGTSTPPNANETGAFESDSSLVSLVIPNGFVNTDKYNVDNTINGSSQYYGDNDNNMFVNVPLRRLDIIDTPGVKTKTVFDTNAGLPTPLYRIQQIQINSQSQKKEFRTEIEETVNSDGQVVKLIDSKYQSQDEPTDYDSGKEIPLSVGFYKTTNSTDQMSDGYSDSKNHRWVSGHWIYSGNGYLASDDWSNYSSSHPSDRDDKWVTATTRYDGLKYRYNHQAHAAEFTSGRAQSDLSQFIANAPRVIKDANSIRFARSVDMSHVKTINGAFSHDQNLYALDLGTSFTPGNKKISSYNVFRSDTYLHGLILSPNFNSMDDDEVSDEFYHDDNLDNIYFFKGNGNTSGNSGSVFSRGHNYGLPKPSEWIQMNTDGTQTPVDFTNSNYWSHYNPYTVHSITGTFIRHMSHTSKSDVKPSGNVWSDLHEGTAKVTIDGRNDTIKVSNGTLDSGHLGFGEADHEFASDVYTKSDHRVISDVLPNQKKDWKLIFSDVSLPQDAQFIFDGKFDYQKKGRDNFIGNQVAEVDTTGLDANNVHDQSTQKASGTGAEGLFINDHHLTNQNGFKGLNISPDFGNTTGHIHNWYMAMGSDYGLTSLDVRNLDISDATNLMDIFDTNKNLKTVTLGGKFNTKQLNVNMNQMFADNPNLRQIINASDFGKSFDKPLKIELLNQSSDRQNPISENKPSAISMNYMFGLDRSLSFPNHTFYKWDTSNVTDMGQMFQSDKSLGALTFPDSFHTSNVTNMGYMFGSDNNDLNTNHFNLNPNPEGTGYPGLTSLTFSKNFDTGRAYNNMNTMFGVMGKDNNNERDTTLERIKIQSSDTKINSDANVNLGGTAKWYRVTGDPDSSNPQTSDHTHSFDTGSDQGSGVTNRVGTFINDSLDEPKVTVTYKFGNQVVDKFNGKTLREFNAHDLPGANGSDLSGTHGKHYEVDPRLNNWTQTVAPNGNYTIQVDQKGKWGTAHWDLTPPNVAASDTATRKYGVNNLFIHDGQMSSVDTSVGNNTYNIAGISQSDQNRIQSISTSNVIAPQDSHNLFGAAPSYGNDTNYGQAVLPSLKTIDVSGLDTSEVIAMNAMFNDDPELTTIKGLSDLKTNDVGLNGSYNGLDGGNTFADMFSADPKLTSLDLSHFYAPHNQWIDHMFAHDYSLRYVNLGGSFVTPYPRFSSNTSAEVNTFLSDKNLTKITLNSNDHLGSNSNLYLGPYAYNASNHSDVSDLEDGKTHPGTWIMPARVNLQYSDVMRSADKLNNPAPKPINLTGSHYTLKSSDVPRGYRLVHQVNNQWRIEQPGDVTLNVGSSQKINVAPYYSDQLDYSDNGTNVNHTQVSGIYGTPVPSSQIDANLPAGYHVVRGDQNVKLTSGNPIHVQISNQDLDTVQYWAGSSGSKSFLTNLQVRGTDGTDETGFINANLPKDSDGYPYHVLHVDNPHLTYSGDAYRSYNGQQPVDPGVINVSVDDHDVDKIQYMDGSQKVGGLITTPSTVDGSNIKSFIDSHVPGPKTGNQYQSDKSYYHIVSGDNAIVPNNGTVDVQISNQDSDQINFSNGTHVTKTGSDHASAQATIDSAIPSGYHVTGNTDNQNYTKNDNSGRGTLKVSVSNQDTDTIIYKDGNNKTLYSDKLTNTDGQSDSLGIDNISGISELSGYHVIDGDHKPFNQAANYGNQAGKGSITVIVGDQDTDTVNYSDGSNHIASDSVSGSNGTSAKTVIDKDLPSNYHLVNVDSDNQNYNQNGTISVQISNFDQVPIIFYLNNDKSQIVAGKLSVPYEADYGTTSNKLDQHLLNDLPDGYTLGQGTDDDKTDILNDLSKYHVGQKLSDTAMKLSGGALPSSHASKVNPIYVPVIGSSIKIQYRDMTNGQILRFKASDPNSMAGQRMTYFGLKIGLLNANSTTKYHLQPFYQYPTLAAGETVTVPVLPNSDHQIVSGNWDLDQSGSAHFQVLSDGSGNPEDHNDTLILSDGPMDTNSWSKAGVQDSSQKNYVFPNNGESPLPNALSRSSIGKIIFQNGVTLPSDSSSLFAGLNYLRSVEFSDYPDASHVKSMNGMFGNDPKLPSLDLNSLHLGRVSDLGNFLAGDTRLVSVKLAPQNTDALHSVDGMFASDRSLTGNTGSDLNGDTMNLNGLNTSDVADMSNVFRSDSGLKNLNLSGWQSGHAKILNNMFSGDTNLMKLDLKNMTTDSLMENADGNMFQSDFNNAQHFQTADQGGGYELVLNHGMRLGQHSKLDGDWSSPDYANDPELSQPRRLDQEGTNLGPETYAHWIKHEPMLPVHIVYEGSDGQPAYSDRQINVPGHPGETVMFYPGMLNPDAAHEGYVPDTNLTAPSDKVQFSGTDASWVNGEPTVYFKDVEAAVRTIFINQNGQTVGQPVFYSGVTGDQVHMISDSNQGYHIASASPDYALTTSDYYVAPDQGQYQNFILQPGMHTVYIHLIGKSDSNAQVTVNCMLKQSDGSYKQVQNTIQLDDKNGHYDRYGDSDTISPSDVSINGYSPTSSDSPQNVNITSDGVQPNPIYFDYEKTPYGNGTLIVHYVNSDGWVLGSNLISEKVGQTVQLSDQNTLAPLPVGYYLKGDTSSDNDSYKVSNVILDTSQEIYVPVDGKHASDSLTLYQIKRSADGQFQSRNPVKIKISGHVGDAFHISPYGYVDPQSGALQKLVPRGYYASASDHDQDVRISPDGQLSQPSIYYDYLQNYQSTTVGAVKIHYMMELNNGSLSELDQVSDHGISGDSFDIQPYLDDLPVDLNDNYELVGQSPYQRKPSATAPGSMSDLTSLGSGQAHFGSPSNDLYIVVKKIG